MEIEVEASKGEGGSDTSPGCSGYSGMVHSKKVIKHALRQQAKRRRKNTTIASGNSRTLPRIVVKPLAPPPSNDPPSPPVPPVQHVNAVEEPAATMREVLASLPGFSLKSGRRRSTKRLSAAAQLEAGLVDLETPASILASTSLRALLNRHTFQGLPPLYQRKLAQLLPGVDRQDAATSGLNNEFFARACLEWRKRLAEGEFTPENQQRLKMEAEKDKNKLDPWKLKHFEPIWGDKRESKVRLGLHCIPEVRTGGAVTRSSLRLRLEASAEQIASEVYCRSSPLISEKTTTEIDNTTDTNQIVSKNVENGPKEAERAVSLPKYEEVPPAPSPEVESHCLEPSEGVTEEPPMGNGTSVDYSVEERPLEEQPLEEQPLDVQPLEKQPFEEQPLQEQPLEEQPLEEQPLEEQTLEEQMLEEQTLEEQTLEEQTLEENPQTPISIEPEILIEIKEPQDFEESQDETMQIEEEEAPSDSPVAHQSPEETMEIPETSIEEESNDLIETQISTVSDMQIDCSAEISAEPIADISVAVSHVDEPEVLQVVAEENHFHHHNHQLLETEESTVFQISDCENAAAVESISVVHPQQPESPEQLSEDNVVTTSQIVEHSENIDARPSDPEPQIIPECMEIDSETLQRIHELEVRGEMREAYEEISDCPEIIYPILGPMEIGASVAESTQTQQQVVTEPVTEDVVPTTVAVAQQSDVMNVVNVDDELRDANNYVCSEMLECSWPVDAAVNSGVVSTTSNIDNSPVQENLQVPWPLVAAALDGSVAANITVTTQEECCDISTTTDVCMSTGSQQQLINPERNAESINCIQLPVVQACSPFQPVEALTINSTTTPVAVSSCLMKTVQSPSPPIIAFPSLQSIRFVQTTFHPGQQNLSQAIAATNAIPAQIQNQHNPQTHQLSIVRPAEEIVQFAAAAVANQQSNNNVVVRTTVNNNMSVRNAVQANVVQATVGLPTQVHQQSAIVVQHQTPIVTAQSRQIVANMQTQQYSTNAVPARNARGNGQGSYRSSRSSNKEQGGGRSRSSTKEPPGAVNLERSYQICQAVIQSSPNRDQLKAHLKPPPSLLARGDGAFTTSKPGGRTITAVKTQKNQQSSQHGKQTQNKAQAVMLRQVFATARQAPSVEITENNAVAQLSSNGTGGFGQYILVQRTGLGDGAPRASSAPPLPPQIAGFGVHLVRGRPASAGEGSHQAVTLKARGISDGRGGGGAEPGAPGVIMGGDPPPPCECNMRGAMVICRQCGAFCHDDCIGPQRICATCLIR